MWQHPLKSPESSKTGAGKGAESSDVAPLNSGTREDRQEETEKVSTKTNRTDGKGPNASQRVSALSHSEKTIKGFKEDYLGVVRRPHNPKGVAISKVSIWLPLQQTPLSRP